MADREEAYYFVITLNHNKVRVTADRFDIELGALRLSMDGHTVATFAAERWRYVYKEGSAETIDAESRD